MTVLAISTFTATPILPSILCFLERVMSAPRPVERRELKSLFRPKAAQVLRVMLRDPERACSLVKLAEQAAVAWVASRLFRTFDHATTAP
jgi:hypothetical protein